METVVTKTCNYTFGENVCSQLCHKTKGGRLTAKCKIHLKQAAKKSNNRLKKKNEKAVPSSILLRDKEKSAFNSKVRMQIYREGRKKAILNIENPNARRIATSLNLIKDNKKYIIVRNVISTSLKFTDIVLKGKAEPITFTDDKPPYTRTMQALKNPELVLPDVLEAIGVVFSECEHILVKKLMSKAGDIEQITHLDFVQARSTSVRTLSHFHYSAIISLEDNTQLLVGKSRIPVYIPLHAMLFFRGDMPHAGAGYPLGNSRLFLSASSNTFPVTYDVYLVK
jgi:hypothetical protein